MKKKPWLAAFLNIVIPGSGYLYAGKRKNFGILLTVSSIMSLIWSPSPEVVAEICGNNFAILSMIFFGVALAYDAYTEAKITSKVDKI